MRVLVVNTHSGLNLGDDAILRATVTGLREASPAIQITVASNDPGSWCAFEGVRFVGSFTTWVERLKDGRFRGKLWLMPVYAVALLMSAAAYRSLGLKPRFGGPQQHSLLRAYYDADLVLSCGGGNFYAYRTLSPFFIWALMAIEFALLLGKRVVMLPQSIGPIRGNLQRLLARIVFGKVETILVREQASADYLVRHLGIRRPAVVLPDLAFTMAAPPLKSQRPFTQERSVGVTVLDFRAQSTPTFDQSGYEDVMVDLLQRLSEELDVIVHVFCQCYGPSVDQDDRLAASRVYERLVTRGVPVVLRERFFTCYQAMDAYSEMRLLVGTRMHAGIFALCRGVPALLIGYLPKSEGTMAEIGLGRYCVGIESVTSSQVALLATELLENSPQNTATVSQEVSCARERARSWVSFLGKMS